MKVEKETIGKILFVLVLPFGSEIKVPEIPKMNADNK